MNAQDEFEKWWETIGQYCWEDVEKEAFNAAWDYQQKQINECAKRINELPNCKIAIDGMLLISVDKYNKLIDYLTTLT